MVTLKKLALATALGAASLSANASDLVFDFSGTVDLTFDPAFHTEQVIADYTAIFNEDPAFSTFWGTLVLPDYEQYLTGTHTFDINTSGLELSIVSGLLGEIEGSRTAVRAPNPDYVEGVENCTARQGCDFDGDGVVETPRNNNPLTISLGNTYVPDDTQQGDSGTLTLVDGAVTSFEWYAGANNEGIVGSFNTRLFERQGWLTRIGNISVSLTGATAPRQLGEDVYFSANTFGEASVTMVPEAETYAMLLAGLGVVGAAARRRKKTA